MSKKHAGFRLTGQFILLLLTVLFFISTVRAQNFEVNVATSKGKELSGVKIYAFTESGSYTGRNATTDESGTALFDSANFADGAYKFRVNYLGNRFWSQVIAMPGAFAVEVAIEEETVEVTAAMDTGPAVGVRVYLFSEGGSYLGLYQITAAEGVISLDLPVGRNFKFRADILGGQYWSEIVTVSGGGVNNASIAAGGGLFNVTLKEAPGLPMSGIKVYLFSQSGSYLGLNGMTDESGLVGFHVPEGTFKVRADYLSYKFWGEETLVMADTDTLLVIPHEPVEITVAGVFQGASEPIEDIKVYLFSPTGSYMGQYQLTDADGKITFDLPEKAYKIRADYMGQKFWSEPFIWQETTLNVPMADAEITVTGAGLPTEGMKVYVFSAAGSYLGIYDATDQDGKVSFRIPEGVYKFRADYLGSKFWSPDASIAKDELNPINISTGGGAFTVAVHNDADDPIVGVRCYVFNESDSYLGLFDATDENGGVSFDLADGTYKFRVDYLGGRFWSELTTIPDVSTAEVVIVEETVAVTVQTTTGPAVGIKVYLFSESGSYLGLFKVTDGNGVVSLDLPVGGTFKFRADILGEQVWSDVVTVSDGGVNPVSVNGEGGLFYVTVERVPDSPIEGIKVYLFSQNGSYLGLKELTDAAGGVGFSVPNGTFKVRADYLGYKFWSDETIVTEDKSIVLTIPHQQTEITVSGVFQETAEPIAGIKAYLFSSAGSYVGQYQLTDADGKIAFNLPEKSYKIRADYMGQKFWSNEFTWQETAINVPMADAEITVTGAGVPQQGVKVYVFSSTGSYLGASDTTDDDGKVRFRIPTGSYKFRADKGGNKYWSPVSAMAADQVNPVAIEIGAMPVTVSISADPETIQPGQSSTLSWSSTNADSASINQDIGNVDVTGSISVSPTETTDYTITATGSGGTATHTITVTVNHSPSIEVIEPDGANDNADTGFTIKWSDADPDDDATISIYYDTDSTGADGTLIVGGLNEDPDGAEPDAYLWDTGGIAEGTYHIYAVIDDGLNDPVVDYSDGTLTIKHGGINEVKITADDGEQDDGFGSSVSISGDYAIVGAYHDDDKGSNSGSAYIFKRQGSMWIEQAKLTPTGFFPHFGRFGISVSISEEYAIVGADGDPGGANTGAAYIFKGEGSDWIQQTKMSGFGSLDYFGKCVSISGGYAIVGAHGDDWDGENSGAAYVYERESSGWIRRGDLKAGDAQASDYFGSSVAISDDYAIVGAPYNDEGSVFSTGSVYIFKREDSGWTEEIKLTASDAVENQQFGSSVDISGDYIIVGCASSANGGVYVFKRENSIWTEQAKIASFGSSVSIAGDYAIVGYQRKAYIFKREGSDWTEQSLLTDMDYLFVPSVAISNSHAIVGSYNSSGSAYIYPYRPVSIAADPDTIQIGKTSTLFWYSNNADSCSIDQGIGPVDVNGSISVSPNETATYTITASGPGGTVTENATVTVTVPPATVNLNADPDTIQAGESSTLTWSSTHADSCSIDQGIGPVDVNGSISVSPNETATYIITASGPGGTVTNNVTVTVLMGVLMGAITDAATSLPVENVTVNVTDSHRTQTAHTGTTGEYQIIAIMPGAITVSFTKDEYVPVVKNLSIATDEPFTLNLPLYEILPGATLIGTVTDKVTSQPLQGATVSVQDTDKTQSVQTLEDGSYTVTGITLGTVDTTTIHAGYFQKTGRSELPAEQIYFIDFALNSETALVTVYGIMTNATTLQPEPGVNITVEGTNISDVTLEDGSFILEDVPYGEQSLRVVKEDFCDFIQPVNINRDPFEYNLIYPLISVFPYPAEIDTSITGYVYDAVSGQGLNGAIVRIHGTSIQAATDPDGRFTLTDLPAGTISMTAMALDHEAVLVSPTVVPGAYGTFQFSLPSATEGAVTGIVTDADTGEPIRHARILIGENSLLATESEADGTYTLVGVPAGDYFVTAMHPEYVTAESSPIVVEDAMSTAVGFTLTRKSETGDLDGTITDKNTGGPINEATLTVQGTGITTATDNNGYYQLSNLPAGLVAIAIDAGGYPSTTRTTAVVAHKNAATPTTTTFDIELDASDPTPPDAISELILAEDGGSIESPDSRFMMVVPPGALSGNAIVTLISPTDGPEVHPGDNLTLDPGLGLSDIKALGLMTRVLVEPAIAGGDIPTIQGWVLISGRYFQSEADEFDMAESSIFPYYWDGTQWTVMRVKPYETAVDRINNKPVMVVDFSTTSTGNPVTPQLGTGTLGEAMTYRFVLGGVAKAANQPQAADRAQASPNVLVIDKDQLDAVPKEENNLKTPNPNAFPLVMIHGWDLKTIFIDAEHTDPNEGLEVGGQIDSDKADRFTYIIKDLVELTNGVYRPMFVTHNSKAGMMSIGNALANQLRPSDINGIPSETGGSGNFSYLDTFSFSMGGLIARYYQAYTGAVHNMVLAGTPNHGTFDLTRYITAFPKLALALAIIKIQSPGTADLLAYDDRSNLLLSTNPRLQLLNQNPESAPHGEMTLIAGTDKGVLGHILFLPSTENDGVVPVDSVFCRTSDPNDGSASLLDQSSLNIYESTLGFSHFNFGGYKFRIGGNQALEEEIAHGLSDWVVTKLVNYQIDVFSSDPDDPEYIEFVEYEVRVQYNVYKRTIDRLALVIYAKGENGQWHVSGNYADSQGNITYSDPIEGNSEAILPPTELSTTALFQETDKITDLAFVVVRLKPGQNTVPLEPEGSFGLPE